MEPKRVTEDELGRMREMLAFGIFKDGDLLLHPDGRKLLLHAHEDGGYGYETIGWADGQFAPGGSPLRWLAPGQKPTGDPVADVADAHEMRLGAHEERLTRLERHETGFVERFTDTVRDHRELAEHVQQERADRLNMARQLIELEEAATDAVERVAARLAGEEADNRNARRRLGEVELKVDELARRLHLGEPGFDFPWPPIPRENKVVQVDEIPDVDSLEPGVTYISPDAVTWPISKRRWEMQQVTEQDAHKARRLIDILKRVEDAADNKWGVGLSGPDARTLSDYLAGLDPHCAVDGIDPDLFATVCHERDQAQAELLKWRPDGELHPVFRVTVDLDGDDDADTQTANARRALEDALEQASAGGLIRGWTLDGA